MANARDIIKTLGGRDAVSRLTGATPNAVRAWYRIGVPYRYWDVLVNAATADALEGVTFDALRKTKPAEQAAAAV